MEGDRQVESGLASVELFGVYCWDIIRVEDLFRDANCTMSAVCMLRIEYHVFISPEPYLSPCTNTIIYRNYHLALCITTCDVCGNMVARKPPLIRALLLPKIPRSITQRQVDQRILQKQVEHNVPSHQSCQEAKHTTCLLQCRG